MEEEIDVRRFRFGIVEFPRYVFRNIVRFGEKWSEVIRVFSNAPKWFWEKYLGCELFYCGELFETIVMTCLNGGFDLELVRWMLKKNDVVLSIGNDGESLQFEEKGKVCVYNSWRDLPGFFDRAKYERMIECCNYRGNFPRVKKMMMMFDEWWNVS